MIHTNSALIERKGVRSIGKFVKPDERLAFDKPDSSSKRARVFVPMKGHVEESFVPLDTAVEITDCQSHVCDGRQVRHRSLLVKGMNCYRRSFWPASAPERRKLGTQNDACRQRLQVARGCAYSAGPARLAAHQDRRPERDRALAQVDPTTYEILSIRHEALSPSRGADLEGRWETDICSGTYP